MKKPKLVSTDDVILDICGECDADPEAACHISVIECEGFQDILLSHFYEEGKISNKVFKELANDDNMQYIIEAENYVAQDEHDENQSK